jgi:hypothetical protein
MDPTVTQAGGGAGSIPILHSPAAICFSAGDSLTLFAGLVFSPLVSIANH